MITWPTPTRPGDPGGVPVVWDDDVVLLPDGCRSRPAGHPLTQYWDARTAAWRTRHRVPAPRAGN